MRTDLAQSWRPGMEQAASLWRVQAIPTGALEVVLVSLRAPGDPMAEHERRCFEIATGLTDLRVHYACEATLGGAELGADLLLFGGSGAFSVLDADPWIHRLLDFLLDVVDVGVPAWGSCFGFQGLTLAMGGQVVFDADHARLGGFEQLTCEAARQDPIFGALPGSFCAQFGHHDHVTALPSGVTCMVRAPDAPRSVGTTVGTTVGRAEGIRVDDGLFWAAQFHPELTSELTLHRFAHYRDHYAHGDAAQIEAGIRAGLDRGQSQAVLPAIVTLAQRVRLQRKG